MNKDNAHLYLPFVQALVDGKTIQVLDVGAWVDVNGTDFHRDPDHYRIKPLSFPPKPEQFEWHNPDNLTAEQVGDEWRLLVTEEADNLKHRNSRYRATYGWTSEGSWYWAKESTISVPISTPYPDGSRVVDGKLVKPWAPKFTDKTRRPLPEPPAQIPLGPADWMKDGPWWIRNGSDDCGPCMVTGFTPSHIIYGDGMKLFNENVMLLERSNDGINWTPCHKTQGGAS